MILYDDQLLTWALPSIMARASDRICYRASFGDALPEGRTEIRGFEDCEWLFSSNPLNQGLSRLTFAEAAYLYRLVDRLDEPLVAEIGRFKGGSTFLLAAAGGRVVSIDNESLWPDAHDPAALARALERFMLRDRVEIVVADSHTFPVEEASFDVVFVDGDHGYDSVSADFEHWRPALAPGGHLLFHDAEASLEPGVARLVAEIDSGSELRRRPAAGSLAHFVKEAAARNSPRGVGTSVAA